MGGGEHVVKLGSGSFYFREPLEFLKLIPIAFSAVKLKRVAVALSSPANWESWGLWDRLVPQVGFLRNP